MQNKPRARRADANPGLQSSPHVQRYCAHELPTMQATTKRGMVFRENRNFLKTWAERHVVLEEDRIVYCKQAGGRPAGTIEPLEHVTLTDVKCEKKGPFGVPKGFAWKIIRAAHKDKDGRAIKEKVWYFHSSEKDSWMTCMRHNIKIKTGGYAKERAAADKAKAEEVRLAQLLHILPLPAIARMARASTFCVSDPSLRTFPSLLLTYLFGEPQNPRAPRPLVVTVP